jgi:cell division protein FtsN
MTAKTRGTTNTKQAKKPTAKPAPAKSPPKAAKAPKASEPPKAAKLAEAPKPAKAPITQEMIAARAYQIWLAAGCPHGQDAAIWLRAEAELRKASARP